MAKKDASNPSFHPVRSSGIQSDGTLRRRRRLCRRSLWHGCHGIGAASAIAQTSVSKLALEREKLDEMLGKLMVFAQNQPNGWERAARWVEAKLTGDDRLYAEEKLRMQQMAMQAQEQLPEAEEEAPDLINEEDSRAFA